MHSVCLFICLFSSSSHFISLPWLPILFPLCAVHQYMLSSHVLALTQTHIERLNVTLKHVYPLFHTPSLDGVKCACGSLACVQAAWQYASVSLCG